jgi:Protein of unknown function (DUF2924)
MRRTTNRRDSITRSPLDVEIARLRGLGIDTLRARWRIVFRRSAPPHLPRHLLFAMLAYRIQAEVLGDLDAETIRLLDKVGSAPSGVDTVSLTKTYDQRMRTPTPGTVLTREWNGTIHRVMVVDGGFALEGRSYDSLSKIASAITGTKWNGPRFFGLRDKKAAEG